MTWPEAVTQIATIAITVSGIVAALYIVYKHGGW